MEGTKIVGGVMLRRWSLNKMASIGKHNFKRKMLMEYCFIFIQITMEYAPKHHIDVQPNRR